MVKNGTKSNKIGKTTSSSQAKPEGPSRLEQRRLPTMDLLRGVLAVEACRRGDMDPLINLLDPLLNNPLFVIYLCQILRDETKPMKKVPRRMFIGFLVEEERRRRPGTPLDEIYQDLAESPHVKLKRDGVRRCYDHWRKQTKSQQGTLTLLRSVIAIP